MFSIYLIRNHEHIANITYSPSIIYSLGPETKLGIPTLVGSEGFPDLKMGLTMEYVWNRNLCIGVNLYTFGVALGPPNAEFGPRNH